MHFNGDTKTTAFAWTDRHSRPCPRMKYQTSSIVRWATAFDTVPGSSVKVAMPPRDKAHSTRTSEPSRAITSGTSLIRFVANAIDDIPSRLHSPATTAGRRGGYHAICVA